MRRLANLQLAGPVALLLAVAAADSASWALSQSPSSALLWYLNLEVFSLFRRSRWILSDVGSLPFAQLLLIAGPLAFVALLGMILRRNLLVAVASNLSLVYAAFLLCSWYAWTSYGTVSSASLSCRPRADRRKLLSISCPADCVSGVVLSFAPFLYPRAP